jgi:hypothetical protein
VNCTTGVLLPTHEEAKHGKHFSCACGGGEDLTSNKACNTQKVSVAVSERERGVVESSHQGTYFIFDMYGLGTSENPATLSFTEMAYIKRTTDELKYLADYPTINDYDYSTVFDGNMTGCQVRPQRTLSSPPKHERRTGGESTVSNHHG